jgi:hypothetical protein
MFDIVTAECQISFEKIDKDICSKVSDVYIVIDSRATGIEQDLSIGDGNEVVFFSC